MRTIHNVPAYAMNHLYIVVREAEGGLWFWGAYDDAEVAMDVCAEVQGITITPDIVKIQTMTLEDINHRLEQLDNLIFWEKTGGFDDWNLYHAYRREQVALKRRMREIQAGE